MSFAQPGWIMIGSCCCIALYFLFRHFELKRQKQLAKFAAPHLLGSFIANVSNTKRTTKKYLYIAAVFCCFLALARPQYSFQWVDVKRKGIDIMFAVDTSKSMLTEDIKPNRLERAKFAILDFVQKLEGDRIGLLPFAGTTFLLCPLTVDYDAFGHSLKAVESGIIPSTGTNIAGTLRDAEHLLTNSSNHKILILLSDGENLEGDALQAAKEVAEKGMTVFTIGVGTPGGELIPVNRNGKTGFIKDENGKFVTSKLDEEKLRRIAETTGGIYVPLGIDGQGLETIYQQKLSIIPKEELTERKHKVPIERFEWPLVMAFILLLIEYLLNTRSQSTHQYLNRIKTAGRRIRKTTLSSLLLLTPLLFFFNPLSVEASAGEEAFLAGEYIKASQYYNEALEKDAENPQLNFNHGTASYKNNLFDQAIDSFDKALQSDDPSLQEQAYYNQGNAHYKKGAASQQADPQQTIQQWQKSLKSYEAATALNPDNEDARYNHELVSKKLELLKQQEENKKEQEQNQKQDTNDQQQQEQEQKQQQQNDQTGENQEQKQNGEQNQSDDQQPSPGEQQEQQKNNTSEIEENQASQADQQAEPGQEKAVAQPQKAGEMSEDDARQLLESLKAEEGNLNFIPKTKSDSQNKRDW